MGLFVISVYHHVKHVVPQSIHVILVLTLTWITMQSITHALADQDLLFEVDQSVILVLPPVLHVLEQLQHVILVQILTIFIQYPLVVVLMLTMQILHQHVLPASYHVIIAMPMDVYHA